jgi:hypothetical protein
MPKQRSGNRSSKRPGKDMMKKHQLPVDTAQDVKGRRIHARMTQEHDVDWTDRDISKPSSAQSDYVRKAESNKQPREWKKTSG